MRRSVSVIYDGPYCNNRTPHVQTTDNPVLGSRYNLGRRSIIKRTQGGQTYTVVTYEIPGLRDGSRVAHFTTYFGPVQGSDAY